jgi:flagellin-like protein
MKKIWVIRKNSEAVSPVIATILMVAITVVLAAVLYVMVLGFGGTTSTPNVQVLKRTSVTSGYQVALTSPTSTVKWGDMQIQLTDGTNTLSYTNQTTALLTSATPPKVWHYGSARTMGTLSVWLNVTDLAGDGKVSSGDYFVFTTSGASTFSVSATYSLTIIYTPTGSAMMSGASLTG